MKRRRFVMLVALASSVCAGSAGASSDDAWAEFRAAVATKCTAQAKTILANPIAIVDAFGSESYGIAIVYGKEIGPKETPALPGLASVVCVYDKKTKKAELSGVVQTNFTAH